MSTVSRSPRVPDASWYHANEPCRAACPVGTDAGAYVTAIAAGDWVGAYAAARANNPFPSVCGRVCAAPCETACRRGVIDAPVAIRALKRTATERLGVESRFGAAAWHAAHHDVPPATRPSVAIVGAGPAGMAAAHDLRLAGHRVVVHEASDRAGGMMALGIPAFRLPRAVLAAELDAVQSLGIDVRLNSAVGRDVQLDDLLAEHAAVFVASGCGRGRELDVPGRERQGVISAIEYLLHANRGEPVGIGARVVVIGGGSVAFDVARTARRDEPGEPAPGLHTSLDAARAARRAGSPEVTIVALESREELPTDAAELAAAEAEGIRFRFRTAVTRIDGASHVQGVALAPVRRVYDERGHFAPDIDTEAPESVVPADTVIVAIGQRAETGFVASSLVPGRTAFGGLPVDPATGRTAHPRLWAGGDVARGPRLLIEAIADGQRAARDIQRVLAGDTHTAVTTAPRVMVLAPAAVTGRWRTGFDAVPRVTLPMAAHEASGDVREVEQSLAPADAQREGARCLRCFEQVMLDADRCIACGLCVDVCPEGCLAIDTAPDTPAATWRFSLDETACLRCALCVARCPAGALSLVHAAEACALPTAGAAA